MENINKVINLNNLIRELKDKYHRNIYTGVHTVYNSSPLRYKVHTYMYGDGYINLLILNNKYRLSQCWNGHAWNSDFKTLNELKKQVSSFV